MRGSSQAATFWEDDLESHGAIRIVCVPTGTTLTSSFEECLATLRTSPRIPLGAIPRSSRNAHQFFSSSGLADSSSGRIDIEDFLKKCGDPFGRASDEGSARFEFIENGSVLLPSPFLDLQPHRKAHAVIGICHCPSTPDIVSTFKSMKTRMHKISVDKGQETVWRCFAFDISDAQLTSLQNLEPQSLNHLVPILPDRRLENGHSMQSMQIRQALSNLSSELFANFHCNVALGLAGKLNPPPRLSTASDAKLKGKMKSSRWTKRLGHRVALWAAEHCLLAGSTGDAIFHLKSSLRGMLSEGKQYRDYMWLGAVHQAMAAALVITHIDEINAGVDESLDFPGLVTSSTSNRADGTSGADTNSTIDGCSGENGIDQSGGTIELKLKEDPLIVSHCQSAVECFRTAGVLELEISATLILARYYSSVSPVQRLKAAKLLGEIFESGKLCVTNPTGLLSDHKVLGQGGVSIGGLSVGGGGGGVTGSLSIGADPLLFNAKRNTHVSNNRPSAGSKFCGTESLDDKVLGALSLQVSKVFEALGMRRKSAFFLHLASMHFANASDWIVAHTLGQLSIQAYGNAAFTFPSDIAGDQSETHLDDVGTQKGMHKSISNLLLDERRTHRGAASSPNTKKSREGTIALIKHFSRPQLKNSSADMPYNLGSSLDGNFFHDGWLYIRRRCFIEQTKIARILHQHELAVNCAIAALRLCIDIDGDFSDSFELATEMETTPRQARDKGKSPAFKHGPNKERTDFSSGHSASTQANLVDDLTTIADEYKGNGAMPNLVVQSLVGIPRIDRVRVMRVPMSRMHECREYGRIEKRKNQNDKQGVDSSESKSTPSKHKYSKIYYDPFASKRKHARNQVEWVEGETGEIMVEMTNPLMVEVVVQSIKVIVSGVVCETYAQSLVMSPGGRATIMLGLKPLTSGQLKIDGCILQCFNLLCKHMVDEDGFCLKDSSHGSVDSRSLKSKVKDRQKDREAIKSEPVKVTVVPALPLLSARDAKYHMRWGSKSASTVSTSDEYSIGTKFSLMRGQKLKHQIILENTSAVSVGQLRIKVAIKYDSMDDMSKHVDMTDVLISHPSAPGASWQPDGKQSCCKSALTTISTKTSNNCHAAIVADPAFGCFIWDIQSLEYLSTCLPMKPGDIVALPFTIDSRRSISSAEFIIFYAENEKTEYSRSLAIPLRFKSVPTLQLTSISAQELETSIPESLVGAFHKPRCKGENVKAPFKLQYTDTDRALIVIGIRNLSTHSFDVMCKLRPSQAGSDSDFPETTHNTVLHSLAVLSKCEQRLIFPLDRSLFTDCLKTSDFIRRLDEVIEIVWEIPESNSTGSLPLVLGRKSCVGEDYDIDGSGMQEVEVSCSIARILKPTSVKFSFSIEGVDCAISSKDSASAHGQSIAPLTPKPALRDQSTKTSTSKDNRRRSSLHSVSSYPSPVANSTRSARPIFSRNATVNERKYKISDSRMLVKLKHTLDEAVDIVGNTIAVGTKVKVRVNLMNNDAHSMENFVLQLVPYMMAHNNIIVLDCGKERRIDRQRQLLLWNGPLVTHIESLEVGSTYEHTVVFCAAFPGVVHFAANATSSGIGGEDEDGDSMKVCWSSDPCQINFVAQEL